MSSTQLTPETSTQERILDIAGRLVQRRGYSGFSYADIAGELGITNASLHYHYAGKAELGKALIERYSTRFVEALNAIDARLEEPPAKLEAYADLYSEVLRGDRMCLCGMLAAEYETLPEPMRGAVIRFFDRNIAWLSGVLDEGRSDGAFSLDVSSTETAQGLLGALQGGMLMARPYRDPAIFQAAAAQALARVSAASGP